MDLRLFYIVNKALLQLLIKTNTSFSTKKFVYINYCFKIQAKINGTTIVASDSTINFGV